MSLSVLGLRDQVKRKYEPGSREPIRDAKGGAGQPGPDPARQPRRAVYALRKAGLPLHGGSPGPARPLLPVDPQGKRQDRHETFVETSGRAVQGLDLQPPPDEKVGAENGSPIPQGNRSNSPHDIEPVHSGKRAPTRPG